ncbi:MAG: hypothetical protein MUC95_10450 [Spirochaetes bacterium]|jgi:hypothetical protein|nr:hypothetical protein [Spirochaetota bacterium]
MKKPGLIIIILILLLSVPTFSTAGTYSAAVFPVDENENYKLGFNIETMGGIMP